MKTVQFTHFCLGSVDTRSKQVDTSPRFQKTQLPDWDSRSTLDQSSRCTPVVVLSRHAQFGVVVLQLLYYEPSSSGL
ncbi:hypothetical protein Taro_014156 [Colocasia esculenta]|uniref:Uncharacterized protein n=1 Tax=Colocasia esculenta TaxID=4460 RepID=A0A843UDQ9_COLES|nr:hypothetical protein [Colocasia esculenta]